MPERGGEVSVHSMAHTRTVDWHFCWRHLRQPRHADCARYAVLVLLHRALGRAHICLHGRRVQV